MHAPSPRIVDARAGGPAVGDALRWTGLGLVVAALLGLAGLLVGSLVVEREAIDDAALVDALARGSAPGIIVAGLLGGLVAAIGWVVAILASPLALERALRDPDAAPTEQGLRFASPTSWRVPLGLVLGLAGLVGTPLGLAASSDLPSPWSVLAPALGGAALVGAVVCLRRVLRADTAWTSRVRTARLAAAERRARVHRLEEARRAAMPAAEDFPAPAWHAVARVDVVAGRLAATGLLALGVPSLLALLVAEAAPPAPVVLALAGLVLVVIAATVVALVAFAVLTMRAERRTASWARRSIGAVADDLALGCALAAPRAALLGALALGSAAGIALVVGVSLAAVWPDAGTRALDPTPALVVGGALAVAGVALAAVDGPVRRRDRAALRAATAPGDVRMPTAAEVRERRRPERTGA